MNRHCCLYDPLFRWINIFSSSAEYVSSVVRKNLRAVYYRTVSERPLNCGVIGVGRNPFYRDLTFVCAFVAGSLSRQQKLLENPLNLNSLNSSCSKAEGRICQLTRWLCRNGLRVWHAIWVTEQGDRVMVKSLYEFKGIFIMHCMPFFRITVFTGI